MMSGCCAKTAILGRGLQRVLQQSTRTVTHLQSCVASSCTYRNAYMGRNHLRWTSTSIGQHHNYCDRSHYHSDVYMNASSSGSSSSSSNASTTATSAVAAENSSTVVKDARRVVAGQPTPHTHPHLLREDEVTVGITKEEYRERRAKLMSILNEQEGKHHVLLLPATPRRYMVDKIPYLYRQDTDLLWSTGCKEADCVLLLHTVPSSSASPPSHRAVMFCPEPPPLQEIWDGPRTHHTHATQVWGVDEGLPMTELTSYLTSLEKTLCSPSLWYNHRDPPNPNTHYLLQRWLSEGRAAGLESPKLHMHRARLVKSPAEQTLMRHACRISAESVRATIQWSEPGMSEHQLFAKVDYETRMRGADHLAYPPVVAGGNRANIIHYISNNQIVDDGDMVLMDAGAEYHGYSGDVTRTWPINGRYTSPQRELYEATLHVQNAVLAALRNGRPSVDLLYRSMCSHLASVLPDLGIVSRNSTAEHRVKVAQSLCPHHVSHYLGMDVHDTPGVSRCLPLQPGTIITVEPGIYVPHGSRLAPSRYHGLGVRIEDDVLVTETGYELLSGACPRHPDDIQDLIASRPLAS